MSIGLDHGDSVLIEENPGNECEDDHETWVNKQRRSDVRLQLAHLDDPMGYQRERESAQDADHPGWEVGAEHVNGWRMVAKKDNR